MASLISASERPRLPRRFYVKVRTWPASGGNRYPNSGQLFHRRNRHGTPPMLQCCNSKHVSRVRLLGPRALMRGHILVLVPFLFLDPHQTRPPISSDDGTPEWIHWEWRRRCRTARCVWLTCRATPVASPPPARRLVLVHASDSASPAPYRASEAKCGKCACSGKTKVRLTTA